MYRFLHIAYTILVTFIGGSALFVLGSFIPVDGNYSFHIVESGSMEPAIKTGSVIAIIPRDSYNTGDVVLFEGTSINPQPTTHRIVGREDDSFVTKGDANEEPDYRRIREDEIVGQVFLDVPYAGFAARFFASPTGKATLMVLGIMLVTSVFIPWGRIVRREDQKNATV
ncbi:MAG: signal peptidase I [Candidatus Paceibacterota bacterium]